MNLTPQTPMRTYRNGSSCIHYALGTTNVKTAVIETSYYPFDMGPFDSDHRALYLDFNEKILFKGIVKPMFNNPTKGVNSKYQKSRNTCLKAINLTALTDIYKDLIYLQKINTFTNNHHDTLEQHGEQFTKLLLDADQDCISPGTAAWNSKVNENILIWRYWKITYQ